MFYYLTFFFASYKTLYFFIWGSKILLLLLSKLPLFLYFISNEKVLHPANCAEKEVFVYRFFVYKTIET